MFSNLEYSARERQRKGESRRQASEAQREKERQRSRARDKKKGEIFLMKEQHENSLRSRCKGVLTIKKIANGKQNCRVFPRRNLEPLERIYGRFPSVDPSGRFAGVPNLGKPDIEG